jgi:hypothetical protein
VTKARVLAVADEVANDLGNSQFDMPFVNAGRKYLPKVTVEETDQPIVTVVPAEIRVSPDNRSTWLHEYDIDIGVQHRAKPGQDANLIFDAAMRLTEQIADKYRATQLTLADCVLTAVSYGGTSGLPYVAEHIEQHKQITGIVRLTFQEWR